jgi:hypothetical protein
MLLWVCFTVHNLLILQLVPLAAPHAAHHASYKATSVMSSEITTCAVLIALLLGPLLLLQSWQALEGFCYMPLLLLGS